MLWCPVMIHGNAGDDGWEKVGASVCEVTANNSWNFRQSRISKQVLSSVALFSVNVPRISLSF